MRHVPPSSLLVLLGVASVLLYATVQYSYTFVPRVPIYTSKDMYKGLLAPLAAGVAAAANIDLNWYPPTASWTSDLAAVYNGTGTYGFRFDGSAEPEHGTYSYCNMEHVRKRDYVVPDEDKWELVYVEMVHRHHKRTPYLSNGFPIEPYPWDCSDSHLSEVGTPYSNPTQQPIHFASNTYYTPSSPLTNPLSKSTLAGLRGSCAFPQITRGGLEDSFKHGQDLRDVYVNKLGFIDDEDATGATGKVRYRVTNNPITAQVAGQLLAGLFPDTQQGGDVSVPLQLQPAAIDSLEPKYTCAAADAGFAAIKSANDTRWARHLALAAPLYAALDSVSGVPPGDTALGFHASLDHYFDNLSSRQCHGLALPCRGTTCVSQVQANEAYRIGQWEYSHIYRGSETSFRASIASYGIWVAELAAHIRDAVAATSGAAAQKAYVRYTHNVAHDGSVSRLLSILQVAEMYWPGMGSEVVFEVYKRVGGESGYPYALRILVNGVPLKSSNPSLGVVDLTDLDGFLAYIDGQVGKGGVKVPGLCKV